MGQTQGLHYLMASDFDQTLSFNDSGVELAEILGVRNFAQKVAGLARSNLIQQGGELAYLIRHDPEFRGVRREHLIEAGRRVHLKAGIRELVECLQSFPGHRFSFFVISAAPKDLVSAALEHLVPASHIFGTEFDHDPQTGEVRAILRVPAGYGKVAVLDELAASTHVPMERMVYVGDGSSDVHVMLHVNHHDGFTIAVSENPQLARIARCMVLSDSAFSVLVPVLQQMLGWRVGAIRTLFEGRGFSLEEWEHASLDRIRLSEARDPIEARHRILS
ncbi:MAG TPA: HAD-IB family phosphatase [Steroidobacteraceae bacterium]|nr:HAD-IB family phosphatase [Steroidobacteraceae bacterium]